MLIARLFIKALLFSLRYGGRHLCWCCSAWSNKNRRPQCTQFPEKWRPFCYFHQGSVMLLICWHWSCFCCCESSVVNFSFLFIRLTALIQQPLQRQCLRQRLRRWALRTWNLRSSWHWSPMREIMQLLWEFTGESWCINLKEPCRNFRLFWFEQLLI